jgi:hypothetical protein
MTTEEQTNALRAQENERRRIAQARLEEHEATRLHSYLEVHGVRNSEEWEEAQARFAKVHGSTVHGDNTEIHAFINDRRMIVLCTCGSGAMCAVIDGEPIARCFNCGAVYTNIVLPPRERHNAVD